MFYEQLLCAHIPKAQKKTVKLSVLFALLGSACAKSAHNVDEIDPKVPKYFMFCVRRI